MNGVLHDFKLALRGLRAAPSSTAAAVLILGLGTGVNAAVFAIAYGVLFRPLPYPEPDRLVTISIETPDGSDWGILLDEFEELRSHLRSARSATAYVTTELTMRSRLEPRHLRTAIVTEEFFEVLRAAPVRGRTLSSSEGVAFSNGLASEVSGLGDADLLGSNVTVGTRGYTVSAVMPPSFAFPDFGVDAWIPASSIRDLDTSTIISNIGLFRVLVRLKPEVTLSQAREDVLQAFRTIRGDSFGAPGSAGPMVTPLADALVGRTRLALYAAMAAAILVLLVASANVGTLLLARAVVRQRQLALRAALGASPWRLARGVLMESLLIAGAGSAFGVSADFLVVPLLVRAAGGVIPQTHAVAVDAPVVTASVVVALLLTLLCGAAPALQLRTQLVPQALGSSQSGLPPSGRRLMAGFVVVQVALSIVLVCGTALLARTVVFLLEEDAGFDPARVLTAKLASTELTPLDGEERTRFVRAVLERVRALPGVERAGIGSLLPPIESPVHVFVQRVSESSDEFQRLSFGWVTPGYFEALGGRLLRGRGFADPDPYRDEPVVLLSESAARFLSPEKDPVEQELPVRLPPITGLSTPPRVLGVVDDIKFNGLDATAEAAVYLASLNPKPGPMYLLVRTQGDPMSLAPALRGILEEIDPGLPPPLIASLREEMAGSIVERRMRVLAASSFTALGLAVALVGLFALIRREVAERRRELAVRLAIGASPRQIVRILVARAARLVILGAAAGLLLTSFAVRGIVSLLYGVRAFSPATFGAAAVLVGIAALCASYFPARRAAHLDPVEGLRAE